jgi:hypothetical protein
LDNLHHLGRDTSVRILHFEDTRRAHVRAEIRAGRVPTAAIFVLLC